jgi:hypothetical protein
VSKQQLSFSNAVQSAAAVFEAGLAFRSIAKFEFGLNFPDDF